MPHDIALVDECSADLIEFARTDPLMRRELDRARAVFSGDADEQAHVPDQQQDMDQARLLDWFLFDYRLGDDGVTPLEAYRRLKLSGLSEEKQRVLEDFGKSVYGVFEVTESQPGEGVTLRDLADEKEYIVQERQASMVLARGTLVLGRVIPSDDRSVLSAALSVWSEDAQSMIRSAYERARTNADSMYVSPIDMEKLFWETPRLAAPPEPEVQPDDEPGFPDIEECITIEAADRSVRFRVTLSDDASLDDCIRAVAAATQNPLEVLEHVRARHPICTADEFRKTMDHIHRVCVEYEQAPPVQHFDITANIPLGAGPEERSLTRQFAGLARGEITAERYSTLKLASDQLHITHRRWLDTRQEALGHLTPREVIERERIRVKGRRARPYRQAQ